MVTMDQINEFLKFTYKKGHIKVNYKKIYALLWIDYCVMLHSFIRNTSTKVSIYIYKHHFLKQKTISTGLMI